MVFSLQHQMEEADSGKVPTTSVIWSPLLFSTSHPCICKISHSSAVSAPFHDNDILFSYKMPAGDIIANSACNKCINVLILERKSGTENIKCLIDFLGGWESRLGREPHMLLSSMLSSLLLSKTLQITPPCPLEYWLTQSEPPRVLRF